MLKISQELGEVAEALHGALGANPRKGASPGVVSKELADVIVTAAVVLDTVSGNGAAVVEHQLQNRAPDDLTGNAWDSMEERLRFSWRGPRPRLVERGLPAGQRRTSNMP
ncbi:MazG-like family protein [Streptomyces lasiicapitis]|uniref:MazG-like family protein n=1 Tax=Streptomyces lasiicapitis TaxID=1923961 RepID=UPI0036AA35E1